MFEMQQNFPRVKFGVEISKGRRSVKARFPNRSSKSNTGNERDGRGERRGDEGPTETNGKALVSVAQTKRDRKTK